MQKIIGGRLYDTDKAIRLGGWRSWPIFGGDLYAHAESLYMAPSGAYFVVKEGFINSDKCNVLPLSENDARMWAEENLSVDDYIKAFGEAPNA